MAIKLSNGHVFTYLVASGALKYDGSGWWFEKYFMRFFNLWNGLIDPRLFTVIGKSITREPKKGNLKWTDMFGFGCVRHIKDGVVNAVGLTNPGFDWWMKDVAPRVKSLPWKLIMSLYGTPEELAQMAKVLEESKCGIVAIEVNVSCPNTHDGLPDIDYVIRSMKVVKENTSLPIIAKLSPDQDYKTIVPLVASMVEAIDINTAPWNLVFDEALDQTSSPLAHLAKTGGGVSLMAARGCTWRMIRELVGLELLPVIGCGIMKHEDMACLLNGYGVRAISFGAIHIPNFWKPWTWGNPAKPTRFVRKHMREQAEKCPYKV